MRKYYILFVMFYAMLSVKATSFLDDGKTWKCHYFLYFYKEHHFGWSHEEELRVEGIDAVNGTEYHIVRYEPIQYDSNSSGWDTATYSSNRWGLDFGCFILHIREEGGRVFVLKEDYLSFCQGIYGAIPETHPILSGCEDEVLLYDFNLEVGDTYPNFDSVTVVEVGELHHEGLTYNYQLLSNSLLIVEGIGCVNSWGGIVAHQFAPIYYTEDRFVSGMAWVVVNDRNGKIFDYSPSVDEDMLLNLRDMPDDGQSSSSATYDLQGRRVTSTPQRGIYIRKGKKYVNNKT